MKEIQRLNISTFYRASFDNIKVRQKRTMIQVRSRERYFKRVVTLSFSLSYRMDEIESSQSYRAISSSKNPKELSHFFRAESTNDKSSLLVEGNRPKL